MNAQVIHSESTSGEAGSAQIDYRFEQISDADLLASTRRLVGRSNQLLATLLAHLAEVEARGIHRLRACASLYTYCVYELRLSEDAAFRRARAARLARRFPLIFQQVADGELHLTALTLLAPHLTDENHRELLALAKHRTKREVLRLVCTLAPQPTMPDRVEPLGPERVGIPMPGVLTWRKLVESLASGVRELSPGDRPKDWREGGSEGDATPNHDGSEQPENEGAAMLDLEGAAAAAPERYRVQFTASQEYADLLERAQDLLSHAVPNRSLEEVHLRALRLLVEQLEKRKYGAPRPKQSVNQVASESVPTVAPSAALSASDPESTPGLASSETPHPAEPSKKHAQAPRQRGAATVRREVRDRDGLQCTFVDEFGQRCRETRFLELHHEHARALGGRETVRNLTMRCQAHNALAAEQDFGRDFVLEQISRRRR